MLTPITTPPTSISPEEHAQLTSSTPASFADIPPILRWTDDVQVTLNPSSGGWEGWSGGKVNGKLYVTEEAVSFIPHQPTTPGFSLPFPSLTLHALTPASDREPAHLYCQVDEGDAPVNGSGNSNISEAGLNGNGNGNGVDADAEDEDEGEGGEEEYTALREVRIYVADDKLEILFQALSQCSALHASLLPNGEPSSFFGFPTDDDDDDEEEDGQWEDAAEDESGDGQGGRVRVIHFGPSTYTVMDKYTQINSGPIDKDEDEDTDVNNGEGQVEDQMERFLNLVDWGDVPKPKGWDE